MLQPAGYSDLSEDEYDRWRSEDDEDEFLTARNGAFIENEEESLETKLSKFTKSILFGQIQDVTNFITEDDIDVTVQLRDGWTPITLAASVGDPDMLEYLINNGADVRTKRDMVTTLMLVCNCPSTTSREERLLKSAELLISKGVDVTEVNIKRINAVMYAANQGYLSLVKLLLPLCDKDAKDNQGWTVLFWAINENRLEVVKFLLEQGLNPNIRDIRANKPLHYARMTGNFDLIDLLPQEEKNDYFVSFLDQESYNFEEMFSNLAPNEIPDFEFDVSKMLHGMKCQNLSQTFKENWIKLSEFLTLDEEKLVNLGIKLPYQRQRILGGLYKLHKHPWKRKSLPPVNKLTPYTTVDLMNAIGMAVRQIIVFETTLLYLKNNTIEMPVTDLDENMQFRTALRDLHQQYLKLKKTTQRIQLHTSELDENYNEADLITKDSRNKLHKPNVWKLVFNGTVLCSVGYILYKNQAAITKVVYSFSQVCLKMIKK